jgi:hypothetical protein
LVLQRELAEKHSVPTDAAFAGVLEAALECVLCCVVGACICVCSDTHCLRKEGIDLENGADRDPLFYTRLLDQTRTHGRAMGVVGKAAQQIINERRTVERSSKGKKVCLV